MFDWSLGFEVAALEGQQTCRLAPFYDNMSIDKARLGFYMLIFFSKLKVAKARVMINIKHSKTSNRLTLNRFFYRLRASFIIDGIKDKCTIYNGAVH